MSVATEIVTAEELLGMPGNGRRYELVRGELREMAPAGGPHGNVGMRAGWRLAFYVEEHNLGVVFAAETGFKIASNPDTVRAPDVAFVRRERIDATGIPKGYWPGAPDLVIEVVSPSDSYEDVEAKVFEWLDAGTRMVVVLKPGKRSAAVYRGRNVTRLIEHDTLSGDDVVPGWSVALGTIFG